jgi:hypothetical protein
MDSGGEFEATTIINGYIIMLDYTTYEHQNTACRRVIFEQFHGTLMFIIIVFTRV